jgi:adenylate cyclase
LLYLFDNCSLDIGQRELRRDGIAIPLQPQVFDVLEYLIRHRDRVVTKDDLISAIWNGRIVSESSLTSRINAARAAIGDSGEAQRLIKTLPRKGIRFVGGVREEGTRTEDPLQSSSHSVGERTTRPSLAVLPFDNLDQDKDMASFCDGLVEDAITALSRFRWLNVISRSSSFSQKGRSADIRTVARDLGVRFVLEGSVRRSGGRVRISAQLIDGTSGNQVWADRYDRKFSSVFDLQDDVVRDIVASLEYALWITLVRGDVTTPDPVNSPLRAAGWHIAECSHTGNRAAIACASRALDANSRSVAAYQYLANAYIVELMAGWTEDEADAAHLLEAARRATSLSPGDHLSHGLYAVGLVFAGKYDEALAHARRALALNGNSINVLGPCGNVLSFCGEAREANEMLERMLRLAPAHYFRVGFLSQMALNWLSMDEPKRAAPLASEALKLRPEAICCHVTHAGIAASLGHHEAARTAVADAFRYRPDLDEALINAMFPHCDKSIPARFAELLGID